MKNKYYQMTYNKIKLFLNLNNFKKKDNILINLLII